MPPEKDELFDIYQEQQSESEKFWDRVGKCLGYISELCSKCGRARVEQYEHGDLICEKCNWNETTQAYEKFLY